MSDVDTMVAWLRGVLDADEQAALAMLDQNVKAAMLDGAPPPRWVFRDGAVRSEPHGQFGQEILRARTWPSEGDHIARHDPADTLARIEAERAILAEYASAAGFYIRHKKFPAGEAQGLLTAVRALASGYRHRAGWQEGWAP